MIEIDELIIFYRSLGLKDLRYGHRVTFKVLVGTITYLEAFKQEREMLKNLGDAIKVVDLGGDGT
jgi:hypothetical protein